MSKKSSQTNHLKFIERLSDGSQKNYQVVIKEFEEFHHTSIDELIEEALNEQSERIPTHQLKLIDRVEEYQEYLIDKGLVHGTIQLRVTLVKTIYKRNRVTLPYFEPLDPKRTKRREYIEYKDIPTKEEIKSALQYMRLPAQARAITMAQGGLSNEECEHLTTRNFIDELYKYHQCDNDIEALIWLKNKDNPVIWVTKLIRQKTKKPYYAVIGAEAVNRIAEAKLYELGLPKSNGELSDKLLNTDKMNFIRNCRVISNKLGLPKVAEEAKIRPHMLRKFHSTRINGSTLSDEESHHLSNYEIDELQGRGKTAVQDTYIKTNPLTQKLLYAKVMNNLALYDEYDYECVDGDIILHRRNQLLENKKLLKENKKLKKEIDNRNNASQEVNRIRDELGEDSFNELVLGILNAK